MNFISPKTDFAFKKIFASSEHPEILISFLNAMLYGGEPTIQEIEIIDPYSAGSVTGLKDSYLDVKAKITGNKTVIVEMQVINVAAFEKRVVYNAAKSYSIQLKKGIEQGMQQGIQQGIEQGIERGKLEGQIELIVRQIVRRVGEVAPEVKANIQRLSSEQLDDLGEALLDFTSQEDLIAWLEPALA